MRVIAGTARSHPLKAPNGDHTRPTIDKHKETLFNCLQMDIPGCVFVDLFAGTGAIGIEALSRGAKRVYFVENNNDAIKCIKDNLKATKLETNANVIKNDVLFFVRNGLREHADIIFMDPPFADNQTGKVIEALSDCEYVDEDTIIVCESLLEDDFSFLNVLGFEIYKEKDYKTCKHTFIRKKEV